MKHADELRKVVLDTIEAFDLPAEPASLYDPIKYILTLGGKRMRPVATLMGCDMFGGDVNDALSSAMAIEVFHNFSLIHDDIMDEAPLRRGKQTVHQKWNGNVGILSGDAMLVKSYQLLAQGPAPLLPNLLSIFNTTALEVCEGQQYDMDFEQRLDVSIAEYLEMIRLKTAVLLGASLKIGALIGGASHEDAQHLCEFGQHLGIAFQLQDDILDVYADADKFGKQVGGDIIANKKTYLLITALQKATGEKAELLGKLLGPNSLTDELKVESVKTIYADLQVRAAAEQAMQEHFAIALKHIAAIGLEPAQKAPLLALADQLMVREH
jgi:geranylgeranyl diphosphate synthase type II